MRGGNKNTRIQIIQIRIHHKFVFLSNVVYVLLRSASLNLAELVVGKSKVKLQQYTQYADSGQQSVGRRKTGKR